MSRQNALMITVVSAACFGTLAILTPLAYQQSVEPLPLLTWRFIIAAVLLGGMAMLRNRRALVISKGDLGRYAVMAFAGYGASSICFFYALRYADASVVSVLLYAYPALVALAAWPVLGERIDVRRAAAVAVTFLGCALVVGVGSRSAAGWQGIVLGLGAALGYTSFNLLSARWLPGRSRLTMMAYTFGLSALIPAIAVLVTQGPQGLSVSGWSGSLWLLVLAIVMIPTFLATVLYLEGIRWLGPPQASVVSTFEPLFTITLAAVILGERLTGAQLLGALLVLVGVVAAEMSARRTQMPAPV